MDMCLIAVVRHPHLYPRRELPNVLPAELLSKMIADFWFY